MTLIPTIILTFQSLGNNEVDKKTLKISPFLENIDTYILACNVIIKSAEGKANIKKSIVFDIQGVKVGVVGYLTPENSILDSAGHVEYIDEVLAITEEVEKLQASNVNIIIALGHSNLKKERDIAKEVAGIDMIIAGNINTFNSIDDNTSDDHQAIVVTQPSGKLVPIIPSTAYDKYLGSVTAKFDKNGDFLEYNVDPILLDSSIPQDSASLEIVKSYSADAIARNAEVIGNTSVVLDGESCDLEECNLGNLVADAIVYCYATRYEGREWTDASIAIINEATVLKNRNIAPPNRPANITRGDLLDVLQLQRGLVGVTLSGRTLRRILETSVREYELETTKGVFLQFSGIRVVYDLSRAPGSRLVSAVARCWHCDVPGFYEIEDWASYRVLMPAELGIEGRYGFSFLTALPRIELEYDVVTCTEEFIKLRSPLYPEVAGRIVLIRSDASSIVLSSSLLLVALISFALT